MSECLLVWWLKPMKTYYFCSLQKPFFLYIKITFIMLGYTTSSWSQVALPTKVGDLIQILFSFIKNINWWFKILFSYFIFMSVSKARNDIPTRKIAFLPLKILSKFMEAQKDIYFPYIRFSTLFYINIIWVKPWKPFLSVLAFWDVSKGNYLSKFP